MRKKFLSLALVTAVLALVVLPTTSLAETAGDSSSARVNVLEDGTLTITLNGEMTSISFQATTAISQPTDTDLQELASDNVSVVDYTGGPAADAGHYFALSFDDQTWAYGGPSPDPAYSSIRNDTDTIGTTGNNEISFELTAGTFASFTFTNKVAAICTGGTSTMTMSTMQVTNLDKVLGRNTQDCEGTSVYKPKQLKIVGPNNGFGVGTYTQAGTVTLTDGQT